MTAASTPAPDLFKCDKTNMHLTPKGCGRMWANGNNPEDMPKPWHGRAHCIACPVGARNAGVQISSVAAETYALGQLCSRCRGPAERLIKRRFCISCYNRQMEADRGRNAKGNRPRLCNVLHSIRIAVFDRERLKVVAADQVTCATELLINQARKAVSPICFGWPPALPIEGDWDHG